MPKTKLPQIIGKIVNTYGTEDGINHIEGPNLPSRDLVHEIATNFLDVLFPGYYAKQELSKGDVTNYIWEKIAFIYHHLSRENFKSLKSAYGNQEDEKKLTDRSIEITFSMLNRIPDMRDKLRGDVLSALDGDPAAKNLDEIILCYPGIEAIAIYRVAHEIHLLKVPLIPRIMTEYAHSKTGIDIHPGATIGEHFFIDHGTGVVIGETTEIGNNVRIYQGVTLGALSVKKDTSGNIERGKKRHPTIKDNVIIYAGATILGGKTVVGENSIIGGSVWLTESVPPCTLLFNKPPELTKKKIC
ncbi:MAG: serine acetyltransferase [Deltaproteobacteria bacterium]|jgi:serine O-acetyltransferase|nr:serine acetyltransferase [Deltaproteobacteria bacterium]MCK5187339.1 serine acetyltransferase [Deltaproteobacteria bacterium]MCK5255256.1 serine acetyltransferase [Deltaproteobacteria bacterium]MCK5422856.1 serine acetyltransferase [Deltaproteobacteria bacterium]